MWDVRVICGIDILNQTTPLTLWDVFKRWLKYGMFRGHRYYLWNTVRKRTGQKEFGSIDEDMKNFFLVCAIITTSMFYETLCRYDFSINDTLQCLMHPSGWRGWLETISCAGFAIQFIINMVIEPFLIPYQVYIFNARYFRCHYDDKRILKGDVLPYETYAQSAKQLFTTINKDNKEMTANIENGTRICYDSDSQYSGFFKSLFTLGDSSRLKSEIQELRYIKECSVHLGEQLEKQKSLSLKYYKSLLQLRKNAFRDLWLAKELVNYVKDKVASQETEMIIDKMMDDDSLPHLMLCDNMEDINVNYDTSWLDSGKAIASGVDYIIDRIDNSEENDTLDSTDWAIAGLVTLGEGLIDFLGSISDLNSNVSEARKQIAQEKNDVIKGISKAYKSSLKSRGQTMRHAELIQSLYACHKAFVHAYEPLRKIVFGEPSWDDFRHGSVKKYELTQDRQFVEDLKHLLDVCKEFSKIYKSK